VSVFTTSQCGHMLSVENVAIFDLPRRTERILKPIRHFSRSFVSCTTMRMTAELAQFDTTKRCASAIE